MHRGGGLASQAAGTPRRRGLRKCLPGWMWRQQPQCALHSLAFSDSCFWAGPVPGTWQHRCESSLGAGRRGTKLSGPVLFPLLVPRAWDGARHPVNMEEW